MNAAEGRLVPGRSTTASSRVDGRRSAAWFAALRVAPRFLALAALVAAALVLRVWALDGVPPGLDADEVSLGYNAYAILRTGRDEHGAWLPLAFRAYGDLKRPLYVYAAVPSVAAFGPTPLGVRLPAAVAGALSVAALYAVAALLFRRPRPALAAAAFLAISPWHLQFTRAAREGSLLLLACLLLAAALLAAFHAARGADRIPSNGPALAPASGFPARLHPPSRSGKGNRWPTDTPLGAPPVNRAPPLGTEVPLRSPSPAGKGPGVRSAPSGRRPAARTGLLYVAAAVALLAAAYADPAGIVAAPLLALVLVRAYWGRARLAGAQHPRAGSRRGAEAGLRGVQPPKGSGEEARGVQPPKGVGLGALAPRGWALGAAAIAAAGLVPLGAQLAGGWTRGRDSAPSATSVFASPQVVDLASERMARDRRLGAPWPLQHAWVLGARLAVDAYVAHFNPTFLFTRGDADWRYRSNDGGELYLWDLPLLAAGAVAVARGWRRPPLQAIGGWLLVTPLAASFALGAPHAARAIVMLPGWYLLAAAGVPSLWHRLRRRGLRQAWLLLLALSAAFYLYTYYRFYPVEHDQAWHSGLLEGYRAAQAEVDAGRFARVVIPRPMGLTYAYALFATGYDPRTYLAQGGTVVDPLSRFYPTPGPLTFAPFEVRVVDWETEPRAPNVLYALEGDGRVPPDMRAVLSVVGAGGHEAIKFVAFER